ncbi:MAG: glycosyltransferase [Candidatus Aenigmarchaeota archaeon]|nr:glycosyltransferase [Candidatus Aenigmarchaeota archaeon]
MKFTLIIPTYNEGKIIEKSILKLENFLEKNKINAEVIISDGGSLDNTLKKSKTLKKRYASLEIIERNNRTGKGKSIEEAIKKSKSNFIVFMDADLSVNLDNLPKIINYLKQDYDIAIGSRFDKNSEVKRKFTRKVISSVYSCMIQGLFGLKIKDYQCGFKGFNRKKIMPLLDKIENKGFFWDTELIIKANAKGLKIKEFGVQWEETRNSSINILATSLSFLKSIIWLRLRI